MEEKQKKTINWWLELARIILAAISGLVAGQV